MHVTKSRILSTDLPITMFEIRGQPSTLNDLLIVNIFLSGSKMCAVNAVFISLTEMMSVYLSLLRSPKACKLVPG